MSLQTTSFAEGDIEVMFLAQNGHDPFTATPERTAQITEVASRIARFIAEARSTLDIAIYDFRLHDDAANIIANALRVQAKVGVVIRLAYDRATNPDPDAGPAPSPVHIEADKKPPGTDGYVRSFTDVAQVKDIGGYRVLMHNKYIVRDAASADAAVFTGSSNYSNDSWGLQDNNLLFLRSQQLASYYLRDFNDLWSRGKIVETTGAHDAGTVQMHDVPVTVAFTPGDAPAVVKEIVGAITAAQRRLYVASVVLSSGRSWRRCRRVSIAGCRSPASMMGRKWIRWCGNGRRPMSGRTRSTPGRRWRAAWRARIPFPTTASGPINPTTSCTTSWSSQTTSS
jgi:PLD-like domain